MVERMRVPRQRRSGARCRAAADQGASSVCRRGSRRRWRWPASQAAARRPGPEHVDRTDRPFVTLDPGRVDRPRPGLRPRAIRRRHRAALRHRRRRVLRRRRRRTGQRGVAARRDGVHARRAGPAVPGSAVGGRRKPAARRASPGRRVHVSASTPTASRARRRRTGRRAQPGEARLRDGAPGRPAARARRPRRAHATRGGATQRAAGRVPRSGARCVSTAGGRCASSRGARARTSTPACRWRPTSPSPAPCWRRAPASTG